MPSMGGTNIFHATLVISHATRYPIMCSCVSRTCAKRHRSWTTSGTDGGHGLHVQSLKYNNKQCAVRAYHMTNSGLQSPDMA